MAIFVDIFMAACLLLALVLGVRQGFLQSLARVAIIIVALLGAAWLAEHLADPAAKWLEPMLTEKIQQQTDRPLPQTTPVWPPPDFWRRSASPARPWTNW